MNYAHLHIVLNHFPTIGTVFGLGAFAYSIWKKDREILNMSFVVFLVMAMVAIPTAITGGAADIAIQERPGVNLAMVELHRDAAIGAFCLLMLTGTFAWLALWQYRRYRAPSTWTVWTVGMLAVITLALMLRTGTLGGEISHPEIRVAGAPEVTAPPEGQEGVAQYLQSWLALSWGFPACETLHFTGLALLMGVTLLINFRLLGVLDELTFSSVHRFLPLGILGFGMTMISGMLMFNSDIGRYAELTAFVVKMLLTVVAGLSVLYVTTFDDTWTLGEGVRTELRHKVFAVSTTLLWLGIMWIGRMLPALGSGN
jgi:uncharacterized membrane protein